MKYLLLLLISALFLSCSVENDDCNKTETVCFGANNCVEKPIINGDCYSSF